MLRILLLLVLLILPKIVFSQESTARLLKQLDQVLDQQEYYSNQKESKIHSLRNQITPTSSQLQKEAIYHQLFDEYRVYKSDSALVYARKKVAIANKLNNVQKVQEANLDLTSIMGTLGMYKEAMDVLSTIKLENKSALKGIYYNNNRSIYSYMADYASSDYEKKQYLDWVQKYRDSALVYIKKPSSDYTINLAESLIEKRKYEQALKELTIPYKNLKANDPNRAVFAYIISTIYQKQGKIEEQKKWLILSAISDLELSKKENISLRNLAFLLYEQGDIDRSYRYIQRSLEDALFCNARLRTYEISKMLPIISGAYQHQNKANQKQLLLFLGSISVLTLGLLFVLFQLFKQMKKLKTAQKELNDANVQLINLNTALQSANAALNETNSSLAETNLVKEIYIGRYMDQCSDYIGKLEGYRKKLNVMATAGKMNQLLDAIKSKQFIEAELKEFYQNFDQTFLQLFPDFIPQFEALLIDTELTQLKDEELLNTEMRIFALIRLGIKDSAKIAVFLRYSVSTIYNYRSQLKNKAAGPREEFEAKVMRIGTNFKT